MIDRARQLIEQAGQVVAFSGAGLSAESGVPTFRDAATQGFWTDYDPARLASPQGFEADPPLVYQWYTDRRRDIAQFEPNPAHRALATRPDIINVTQNIDDLLLRAGVTEVIQLHGTIARDHCNNPRCSHTEEVDLHQPPDLRRCPQCDHWMRPSVVWFGEMLPQDAWRRAEQQCDSCDVLLVIGTSAEVYPAAGLIGLAKASGAAVIVVNTRPSAASDIADLELIGPAGDLLPQII